MRIRDFLQAELFGNLGCDRIHGAAAGLNLEGRLRVALAPGLVKLAKLFLAAEQWALRPGFARLRTATLPQFFDRQRPEKPLGTPAAFSSIAFFFCTNAPPPRR